MMLFDVVPDGLDLRLLGAVARQVEQVHVGRRQEGLRLLDGRPGCTA